MAGLLRVRKVVDGKRRVEKRGQLVGMIYKTCASDQVHVPESPWCLEAIKGRVERYGYFDEVRAAAHKL